VNLKERLNEDMKQAMKDKDKMRLSAIRMLRGAIRDREINQRIELDDNGVIEVLSNQIKKRKESVEQFKAANRDDLVQQESAELKVLEAYLPEQLSVDELKALIEKVILEIGATSARDMGKVMSVIMPQVKGKADGKIISQLVKDKLSAISSQQSA
jgi:uncharacterized protein YqeY